MASKWDSEKIIHFLEVYEQFEGLWHACHSLQAIHFLHFRHFLPFFTISLSSSLTIKIAASISSMSDIVAKEYDKTIFHNVTRVRNSDMQLRDHN